jgi:hypothetical protein
MGIRGRPMPLALPRLTKNPGHLRKLTEAQMRVGFIPKAVQEERPGKDIRGRAQHKLPSGGRGGDFRDSGPQKFIRGSRK